MYLQITGCLEWMMHMISNLENDLISLERVSQYASNSTEVGCTSQFIISLLDA